MSSAYLLQHDELYPPGRILSIFRDFGIPCQLRQLHKGDAVPSDLDEVRMLVLLGGALRTTDIDAGSRPFLAAEVATAKQFIDQDRPIIGIGFGAELLSVAGGAKVTENRKPAPPPPPGSPPPQTPPPPGELAPEYGWVNVSFPFPCGTEPAVFGMVDNSPFFAWHVDTFNPPALPPPANPPPPPMRPPTGNVVMAGTRACRNGAYKFKNRVFGYQFHFELEQADIEQIINRRSTEAGLSGEQIAAIHADTAKHYARYERLGTKLVTNLVQFLKAY
jgi:GMP synthase (glutamine-hydrolysing)